MISRRCAADGCCQSLALADAARSTRTVAVADALTRCDRVGKAAAVLAINHSIHQHMAKRLLRAPYSFIHIESNNLRRGGPARAADARTRIRGAEPAPSCPSRSVRTKLAEVRFRSSSYDPCSGPSVAAGI